MEKYVLTKLTEGYVKEICNWRYNGNYSVYNVKRYRFGVILFYLNSKLI
jgi:hypothetical protein